MHQILPIQGNVAIEAKRLGLAKSVSHNEHKEKTANASGKLGNVKLHFRHHVDSEEETTLGRTPSFY